MYAKCILNQEVCKNGGINYTVEARCPGLPPPLLEIGSPVAALWKCFTHKVNEGAEVPLGFPSPAPNSLLTLVGVGHS